MTFPVKGRPVARRILFMDDDDDLRVLAARMAKQIGIEMVLAADGDEAVAAFAAAIGEGRPFQAVILDAHIRWGDGAARVVERLKKLAPEIPAIVTSGWIEDDLVRDFRSAGFDAVLPKPFQHQDLAAVLDRILGEGSEP